MVYDSGKMSFAGSRSSKEPCANYDMNLVIVNADQFAEFAANAGAGFFEGRYTIAQWAWEVEEFPARWHSVFDLVDEVWALSDFTRQSVQAVTHKPVFAAPLPVLVPEIDPGVGRAAFGLPPGRFVFLFCLDLHSVVERKNPVGVIDAFKRAFAPEEGPVLVVKTVNGRTREMDLEMVRYAAAGRTDVFVIDDPLPRPELGSLMAAADCYVSLHRSEGFGLTMAESMALGKPVIATAYSGNLDFMTDENSFLVPFSWALVPPGADPYPPGTRWAEPDLDAAAVIMRAVVDSPDLAATVAERGRVDVQRYHSLERRSEFVRSRFEAIERRMQTRGWPRKVTASPIAGRGGHQVGSRSVGGSSSALRAVQLVAAGVGVAAAKVTGQDSGWFCIRTRRRSPL